MKEEVVELLACPACVSRVGLGDVSDRDGAEIVSGILTCAHCARRYPIRGGIPSFLSTADELGHVARSFGFEWQLHHEGGFEKDTVFGRSVDEDVDYFFSALAIEPDAIAGKRILDAGCGSGTLTVALAERYPETTVLGMDLNPAISEVFRRSLDLPNLHVVCGSVLEPPLAEESFDFVWSNGVLHHTGATRIAFEALTRRVKKGGRAYVWLYEKKLSPMVALRTLLIPLGLLRWNHRLLYRFCQVISFPTWLAVRAMHLFAGLEIVRRSRHLAILARNRGYRELVLTWFDVLSPRYRDTYTEEEIEGWFEKAGFHSISRHWWPVGVSGTRA